MIDREKISFFNQKLTISSSTFVVLFVPCTLAKPCSMKLKHLILLCIFALTFSMLALSQPPAGYYNSASGLSGVALKTTLHNIIKDHIVLSYSSLPTHFADTDLKPNGNIWDIYSDLPGNPPYEYTFTTTLCASASGEGICFNREHTFPRSYVGGDIPPMQSDLFHVYPVDAYVNLRRSNFPYGVVNNPAYTFMNGSKLGLNSTAGYSDTVFEPINAYKGDLARTYFYMATRYENLISGWSSNSTFADAILDGTSFPAFEQWFLAILISWHNADPVSQKEIDRNNAVYAIQGNRNPFIDEPGYVQLIWGDGFAPEPQSHVSGFSANTITLNWMDAGGENPPHAYLIRMSDSGFGAIENPTDGIPVEDDFWNRNAPYGKQSFTFGGLTPGVTYYFKIFSFRGSGAVIDYKTDGAVPQTSIKAR